jgi:hypothetical protein
MIKIWDISPLSYEAGACKKSMVLKGCDRYFSLMEPNDVFKNEMA